MMPVDSTPVEPFRELLEKLYAEPYAKRHRFSSLTLEQIENHLFHHNGNFELPQSFQSCRETFALILHTLELLGFTEYPETAVPRAPKPQSTTRFSQSLPEQYHQVAQYFLTKDDFPFAEQHRTRLAIENLCFSVEAEGQVRLKESLKHFWANRDYEVQRLFEPGSSELSYQVIQALEGFISQQKEHLYDQRFPFMMVTSTLNYLGAVNSEEPLLPSALELACLLLFFGQTRDFEEFSLHNVLFADGLEPDEIVELCFRLLRIHKNKNCVLATGFLPTPQHLLAVQQDCQRVLELLARLQFLDTGEFQSVA